MKLGITTALGGLAFATAASAALTPEDLFEQRSASIFVVHVYDKAGKKLGTGSGVVVGKEQVITNCHVLAKAAAIRISRGNISLGATLEWPDPERDLCQLRAKDLMAPAVPLGSVAKVKVGQRVYAIGAPSGLELTLSDGLVSSLREIDEGKPPLIQTSTPISPGSSGGGLFDSAGNLIGITTFGFRGNQLNFAVPTDWVREVPARGKDLLAKRKEAAEAKPVAAKSGAGSPNLAAVDPTLPKEMPQAGDTWTYVVRDVLYRPDDHSRKFVHTVRSVTRGSIIEVVSVPHGAPVAENAYSADFRAFYRHGAQMIEVAPYATAFRKLHAGEVFGAMRVDGMEPLERAAAGDIPYSFDNARVVGQERVTVAAGTFEALKLELDGRVSNSIIGGGTVGRGYTRFKQTVWYAPEVKRVVKVLAEGGGFANAYELESYSLR
jgi:hypothetical protein